MSFEIVLRKEAQIDLDEIFSWYEEQSAGLGLYFISEFENAITRITNNPYHASVVEGDARSVTLRKFPYEIIYRIDESQFKVRVIAVIHQHRDPAWFNERRKK